MKRLILLLAVYVVSASPSLAGNGDLIVDGNIGLGTSTPSNKLTIDVGSSRNGISLFSDGDESVYSDILMAVKTPALVPAGQPTYFITSFRKDGYFTGGSALGPSLEFYAVRQGGGYFAPLSFKGNGDVILSSPLNAIPGNVGIGITNPSNRLDVNGDIGLINNNNGIHFMAAAGPGDMYVDVEPGTRILRTRNWNIESPNIAATGIHTGIATFEGNVGVGISPQPDYKLYVAGTAYSTGGWQGSDVRFKKNLLLISSPLDKVLSLAGLSYEWKTDEYADKGFPQGRHYGVIAQEIEKVLPEVVNTASDGTKAVAYTEIIPVLIEAIKEQQKLIEKQQSRIEALERMH